MPADCGRVVDEDGAIQGGVVDLEFERKICRSETSI